MGLLEVLKLKPIDVPAPSADAKAKSEYDKARAASRKRIDDLHANAQRAAIMVQIQEATAKLAEADAHAARLEFPQAGAALADVDRISAAARKLADDWAAYARLRASCAAMVSAFKGFDTAAVTASLNATIAQADALVATTPPDFTAAMATLPGSNAWVKVGPPLSCKGPSIGSVLIWSPVATKSPVPSKALVTPMSLLRL